MIIQPKTPTAFAKYAPLLLVFAVGFLVAYTACLFSPLRDDIIATLEPGEPVTEALLNFQWKFAGIGAITGLVAALVYFFMRKNKTLVFKLVFDDDNSLLELHSTGVFTSQVTKAAITYDQLRVIFEKKDKRLSIIFLDRAVLQGKISNDDGVWENEPVKFKQAVALLRKVCVYITEKRSA